MKPLTERQRWALNQCRRHLDQHGLSDWSCVLNGSRRCLGVSDQLRKRIELSRHYVEHSAEEHILDTILHEIAHALVGVEHGHDAIWRAKARQIGATPLAKCSAEGIDIPGLYEAECRCGQKHRLYRKPKACCTYICRCGEPFEWEKNDYSNSPGTKKFSGEKHSLSQMGHSSSVETRSYL